MPDSKQAIELETRLQTEFVSGHYYMLVSKPKLLFPFYKARWRWRFRFEID